MPKKAVLEEKMELTIQKIKQLESQEIAKIVLPKLDSLYQEIPYSEMKKQDFEDLVVKQIDISKNEYKEDMDYIEYIENKIETTFFSQTCEELENENITDSVSMYLQEIGKIPLLTKEEEKILAQQIKEGNQYAKEKFTQANLRWVVIVAKKYVKRGVSFLDLIQEGNMGLMKAVEKFDVTKGFKFSTYATHWISQRITKFIVEQESNICITSYTREKIREYQKAAANLEAKNKEKPTIEQVAQEMQISILAAKDLYKLSHALIMKNCVTSIHTQIGEDKNTELIELIPLEQLTPEEQCSINDRNERVRKLVEDCNFTPREREVIKKRFGFYDGKKMGLQEIADEMDVKAERVRQLQASAIRKLRKCENIAFLADYMDNKEKSIQNLKMFKKLALESKNRTTTFLTQDGSPIWEKEPSSSVLAYKK